MSIIYPIIISLGLSFSPSLKQPPVSQDQSPSRIFVHTRGGQEEPNQEGWREDGTTYYRDIQQNRLYKIGPEGLEVQAANSPTLPFYMKGIVKYRKGAWWSLVCDPGLRPPEDKNSSIYRFDSVQKKWTLVHTLELHASNFEPLSEDRIFLAGVHSNDPDRYSLAAILSSSGSISVLEEIPFQDFSNLFWESSITAIDEQMVYFYFPYPGRIYGYDLIDNALRTFKVPWPLISSESIKKDMAAAAGKDCFISAIGHPGTAHCYFVPVNPGQMLFAYKILDREQEEALADSEGRRIVVEKVSSFLLYSFDPNNPMEWDTPSRMLLDRWCWSPVGSKLVRWVDFMAPKKPIQAPKAQEKTEPPQSRRTQRALHDLDR